MEKIMRFSQKIIRELTISNEYVCNKNKQTQSKSHGQSKLKFKSGSPFFYGLEQSKTQNQLGSNPTHDKYTYKGKISFYKKHIIQFFNKIKCMYENKSLNYKNININDWKKYYELFLKEYSQYKDDDLIIENWTTTNYSKHRLAVAFNLYQKIIFHIAIPYACKIIFYKELDTNNWFIIPLVDFSLLETSYFEKLKSKDFKDAEEVVRKYQAQYRDALISRDEVCVLSDIQTTGTLEAAHIKPFAVSNEDEQKDPNNGLLLTATFHRFFEIGFISFNPNTGELLISDFVSHNDRQWIIKNTSRFKNLKDKYGDKYSKMYIYLNYHYTNIFVK